MSTREPKRIEAGELIETTADNPVARLADDRRVTLGYIKRAVLPADACIDGRTHQYKALFWCPSYEMAEEYTDEETGAVYARHELKEEVCGVDRLMWIPPIEYTATEIVYFSTARTQKEVGYPFEYYAYVPSDAKWYGLDICRLVDPVQEPHH